MNTARWVMAHQVMMQQERRELKKWARFFGTDADAYDDSLEEHDPEGVSSIFPLAAFINPEAYKQIREQGANVTSHTSEIPDEAYLKQVEEMEKRGELTEIDFLSNLAATQVKSKMDEAVLGPDREAAARQQRPDEPAPNIRRRKPRRVTMTKAEEPSGEPNAG